MQGWKIVKHSWQQIFSNFGDALRISAVLYVVIVAPSLISLVGGSWIAPDDRWLLNQIRMVVSPIAGLWITIAWHRYILTGEISDGCLPTLYIGRMWAYFWRSILIFIVVLIPLVLVRIILTGGLRDMFHSSTISDAITPIAFSIPIFFVMFRLGPILPATALGKKLSLKEAWRSTTGSTGAIALIALTLHLFDGITTTLAQPFGMEVLAFTIVWDLVVGWVGMMFGISVLTTIYGHYVEGRELIS